MAVLGGDYPITNRYVNLALLLRLALLRLTVVVEKPQAVAAALPRRTPPTLRRDYLIAWGLIGEPVPRVMTSGGAQKKNS
jgi:hypothetical protein